MAPKSPAWAYEEILGYVRDVESYVRGMTGAQFAENDLVFTACCMKVGLIGEAVGALAKNGFPVGDLPVANMVAMRNIVFHHYADINADIVWETIRVHLPKLKGQIKALAA